MQGDDELPPSPSSLSSGVGGRATKKVGSVLLSHHRPSTREARPHTCHSPRKLVRIFVRQMISFFVSLSPFDFVLVLYCAFVQLVCELGLLLVLLDVCAGSAAAGCLCCCYVLYCYYLLLVQPLVGAARSTCCAALRVPDCLYKLVPG